MRYNGSNFHNLLTIRLMNKRTKRNKIAEQENGEEKEIEFSLFNVQAVGFCFRVMEWRRFFMWNMKNIKQRTLF